MKVCLRSEMDITRRFGRRIAGSNPAGGTRFAKPRLRGAANIWEPKDSKAAGPTGPRRGRENFL